MSATQVVLSERLAAFGLKNASVKVLTSGSQPTLQVEVPHFGGDEHATLETLLTKTDTVEFWNTGPSPVALGSTFDPTQYTQYNPSGIPQFTGADLDPSQVYVSSDQAGRPQISFEMKGDAINRFGTFTSSNVGQYLTVTLDKKVIESAVIQNAITGPGVITGNFTVQEAEVVVSELKFPSLPVSLQIASISSF
jgi:preprotein translocase subunit SecD